MNLLFVTSRLPFPPYGGDKVRVFNFLKYLARNHAITLISFIERKEEEKYVQDLLKWCKKVEVVLLPAGQSYRNCFVHFFSPVPLQVYYYHSADMQNKIDEIIAKERFDCVYIHLLRMAHYLKNSTGVRRVLDLTDAISLSLKRSLLYRRHLFFLFYLLELIKVKYYEAKIIKYFDASVLISKMDRAAHAAFEKAATVSIIANGVDADYFHPGARPYNPKKLVFLGNFHSFPNRDGVLFFHEKIFPKIAREIPDINWYIVGVNPPRKIKALTRDNRIVVTGAVEDVREFLTDAAVLVCPLRVSAGIQNKIIEAMAMGIPVVTTSLGAMWLDKEGREAILIADDPDDFAGKVIGLAGDGEKRKLYSERGRLFVLKQYSWEKNVEKLAKICQGAEHVSD